MERYVIQADLFMPHLIIASCDGGWLILMGWQPSILSMDLQQGAFYFSELAMIFLHFEANVWGLWSIPAMLNLFSWWPCANACCGWDPPGRGVGPCSPLHKVQTLQLRASHFIRVNACDRYFSVKWREGGRISMSILSGKYSVSYLTWNSTRLKCWSRQPKTWHSKSPPQRNPVHATSFQNMELLWQKGD